MTNGKKNVHYIHWHTLNIGETWIVLTTVQLCKLTSPTKDIIRRLSQASDIIHEFQTLLFRFDPNIHTYIHTYTLFFLEFRSSYIKANFSKRKITNKKRNQHNYTMTV